MVGFPPRRALRAAAVLGVFAVALSGCLTSETTLKADGSGTLEMTYRTAPNTTAEIERRRYTSPHVTVDSVQFSDATTAVLKAHFDDITKLGTAEGFKGLTVTRARDGEDERLTIKFVNAMPATIKEEQKPGPKITVNFPAAVRDAGPNAKVSGNTVTWSYTLAAWVKEKEIQLTARWAAPAGDQAAEPAKAGGEQPPATAKPPAKDAPAKK